MSVSGGPSSFGISLARSDTSQRFALWLVSMAAVIGVRKPSDGIQP